MEEDRDKDRSHKLIPAQDTGMAWRGGVSLDVLKSAYIAEGVSVKDLAERYYLTEAQVQKVVDDHKLGELRRAYVREGISKIQNQQIDSAQRLLDLELNFKKLRLAQLEKQLEDYMAYYGRHGDFCKRHPTSGEVLRDRDGIPLQLNIPNVAKEIKDLKESVTLSEGLKKLLVDIDEIINGAPKGEKADDDVIDLSEYDGLFKRKV